MAQQTQAKKKAVRGRRRERKAVPRGRAYVQSTFNNTIVTLCLFGLLLAAGTVVRQLWMDEGETLAGMVVRDRFGLMMQLLVIIGSFLTILFSEGYLREKRIPFGEFYPLLLWSAAGAMVYGAGIGTTRIHAAARW